METVNQNVITLKETIFYAFSGGQESDEGAISGYNVIKAEKKDKEIFYTIDEDHQLHVGNTVTIMIDWKRRYQLMRLHFAAEIVLELMCKKFPSIVKVGAHIAQDKARIDFEWAQKISPFIDELCAETQNIVDSHQEIVSDFSDVENERRYWKIKEFANVPCGGTHIKNTKEIGIIRLKRVNPGKGKERIEIFVHNIE